MNKKPISQIDLAKVFLSYKLKYEKAELVSQLRIKTKEYLSQLSPDYFEKRVFNVNQSIYFTFIEIAFINAQLIDYEDFEPLFIRCLEVIDKIIAEKISDNESMPEYQKFREDVKEFMGRMIDSPKYRDRFKSFPEGFD